MPIAIIFFTQVLFSLPLTFYLTNHNKFIAMLENNFSCSKITF